MNEPIQYTDTISERDINNVREIYTKHTLALRIKFYELKVANNHKQSWKREWLAGVESYEDLCTGNIKYAYLGTHYINYDPSTNKCKDAKTGELLI